MCRLELSDARTALGLQKEGVWFIGGGGKHLGHEREKKGGGGQVWQTLFATFLYWHVYIAIQFAIQSSFDGTEMGVTSSKIHCVSVWGPGRGGGGTNQHLNAAHGRGIVSLLTQRLQTSAE